MKDKKKKKQEKKRNREEDWKDTGKAKSSEAEKKTGKLKTAEAEKKSEKLKFAETSEEDRKSDRKGKKGKKRDQFIKSVDETASEEQVSSDKSSVREELPVTNGMPASRKTPITDPVSVRNTRSGSETSTAWGKKLTQAEATAVFRALGDEHRMEILQVLEQQELCAGDLLKFFKMAQSTLSHHMKILCESGVVLCRKQGKWSYYSISEEIMQAAAAYLAERNAAVSGKES